MGNWRGGSTRFIDRRLENERLDVGEISAPIDDGRRRPLAAASPAVGRALDAGHVGVARPKWTRLQSNLR